MEGLDGFVECEEKGAGVEEGRGSPVDSDPSGFGTGDATLTLEHIELTGIKHLSLNPGNVEIVTQLSPSIDRVWISSTAPARGCRSLEGLEIIRFDSSTLSDLNFKMKIPHEIRNTWTRRSEGRLAGNRWEYLHAL